MKKRVFGVFLALAIAFTCFAAAACGKEEEKPIGDPVTIELNYAESTGMLSWAAVDGATKYTVRLSNVNDSAKTEQTSETSLQLYLRHGLTRITVVAEDDKGRERGNGTKTVSLDVDFGAPAAVTGLAYDKTSGSLSWTASEGAVKYYVSVSSVNNTEFTAVDNREVTGTSLAITLEKGVYDVSVVATDEHDAKSVASAYRYASYVDSTYGNEISEGVYKLFDFDDENVLDLSRYNAEYKSWSTESVKPEWAITNNHEKADGTSETDSVEFDSNALKLRAAYNAEDDDVTRTGAITFTLPEPLENWGRIYYDMFRTPVIYAAGIMLTDVNGKQVLKMVEYNHGDTSNKWGTVSFCKSEILATEPEFGAIAEISFVLVNMKGGVAYFDNVRYDLVDLGFFGDSLYKRSTDTFTFDEVAGAQKYEMYVDDATDPIELTDTEYAFETPLTTGNHSILVVAINGDSRREKTYDFAVGDKIKFNTEIVENSGEYVLADFNTVEYREYLTTTARAWNNRYYNYAIEDGKLNITHNEDWGNGYLDYAFPTEITNAKVIYFGGVTTSNSYYLGVLYKNEFTASNGKQTNFDAIYGNALTSATTLTYTVPEAQKDNPIVGIRICSAYESDGTGVAKTISIDSIIYLSENGVGYLGENCKYVRSSDLFTFGEAFNAESYELYVDGATDPIETDSASYDFSASPLAKGSHSIRVKAVNGDKFREHTYTFTLDDKAKFNVETASGSGEYILADFNTTAYDEYLSVVGDHVNWGGQQTTYSVNDGYLVIDPLREYGYSRVLKYTFPKGIDKSDILYIKVKFTATSNIKMYVFDENGNRTSDIWLGSPTTMTTVNISDFTSLPGNKVSAIGFTCHTGIDSATVNVDEITYEKLEPITNFNTLVDGAENEYLLADFSVNEYKRQLSVAGNQYDWGDPQSTYTLSDGKINVVSKRSWGNSYIKYTLPTALDKNTVVEIKFKYTVESGKTALLYAYDENGNGCYVSGGSSATEATITVDKIVALAGSKIVAIGISSSEAKPESGDSAAVTVNVSVDEITYEKLEPITNFNTLVSGTENEYLLADFSVNGYKQYLSTKGTGKYELNNALTVSKCNWANNSVLYTLPSAIDADEIDSIKVELTKTGVGIAVVYFLDMSGEAEKSIYCGDDKTQSFTYDVAAKNRMVLGALPRSDFLLTTLTRRLSSSKSLTPKSLRKKKPYTYCDFCDIMRLITLYSGLFIRVNGNTIGHIAT